MIKEIHCKYWFLSKRFAGITLYPFIFYNTKHRAYKKNFDALQFHEFVHVEQIRRVGWFKFYLDYLWQSLRFGYLKNKYEIEAYQKQSEFVKAKSSSSL